MARALKAAGGEMVIAGGDIHAEGRCRRAGIDHRPFSGQRASLFQLGSTQALLDTVHQRDLALVHVHGCDAALAAKSFAEAANLPLVMTAETLPATHGFLGRRTARKYFAGRPVIVRSDYAAACLSRDFAVPGDAIRVIRPGISMQTFDPSQVTPERTIALARSWGLADDPRPVVLIPQARSDSAWLNWIMAAAHADGAPDVAWVLIGDPAPHDKRADPVAPAGQPARVRFVNECDDWPAAYKLASVVLSLPATPPLLCEHALQAQAMGRSVITTDNGAGAEAIQPGKTGWLVRHRDPGSLSYAVAAAMERDEVIGRAMDMAARNFIASHYSETAMQSATLDLYREVLAQRAPS
ncbi:glycosyltransferase [Oceanibium sediminis]|uniref:glycosyltransferase n=1 Tax=Oceanibium sediminis TaxID=2026339 RepID=UPI0018E536E0|nr:glycosyltransferase [Oceanibium sediminis]